MEYDTVSSFQIVVAIMTARLLLGLTGFINILQEQLKAEKKINKSF